MGWEENSQFRDMMRGTEPRLPINPYVPPTDPTAELLRELLAEVKALRADMKAKEWREGKGLPRLPKGAK